MSLETKIGAVVAVSLAMRLESATGSTRNKGISRATGIAIVIVVLVVGAAGIYLALGSIRPSSTSSSATTKVSSTITKVTVILPPRVGSNTSLNFEPAKITVVISINNTIVWVDKDPIPHTVTSTSVPNGAKAFDSKTINDGDTYTQTLTVPGTYEYYCTFHPGWMKGTIIVKA